ncbi:hypothetical protein HPB47_002482, partial [Ixodes persulcatus]
TSSLDKDVLPSTGKKLQYTPRRPPGAHLSAARRSSVIRTICDNTNKYAWMHILELFQQLLGLDNEDVLPVDPVPKQLQHHSHKMPKKRNCKMCNDDRK